MAQEKSALIVGASRGLGFAIAQELLARGWHVTGTVRGEKTQLHALAKQYAQQLHIVPFEMTDTDQLAALEKQLSGRERDLLFVNAGITNDPTETIGDVTTEEFIRVLVTNALAPMRVIERLKPYIRKGGIIGAMSSGLGSVANNAGGGYEVYRASKASLNTLMRSFAARATDHALILLAPGWIKTDMGGAGASFTVEEATPDIVDTILAQHGKRGLQYLDRFGKPVPW